MGRSRCDLYHSLRLSRDRRWAEAYRSGRSEPAQGPRREVPRTTAAIISLAERRREAAMGGRPV